MKPTEKNELIGKFWEGNTSRTEEEKLFGDAQDENLTNSDKAYFRFVADARKTCLNREDEIWKNIVARERQKKRYFLLSAGLAASFLLLVSLIILTLKVTRNDSVKNQIAYNETMNFYTSLGIENSNSPTLYINGCKSSSDYHTAIQTINPKCIKYINMINNSTEASKYGSKNGIVEVWLKGKSDEIFSVCEGMLYFYQDGEIKSISIDDECGPNLLIDCSEKPLSEIVNLKPKQIKSIELTINPRNCNGKLDGEFIVMESK
jgi:hypothetical protein